MSENAGKPNSAEAYRLLCERDERAVELLDKLYGRLLRRIAGSILTSREDVEEVVNDTLHDLWRQKPPDSAESLKAYAATVCRRQAIDRLKTLNRKKRRADFYDAAGELEETFTLGFEDSVVDSMVVKEVIRSFVDGLSERDRTIFLKRFFLFQPPEKIAASMKLSRNLVYVSLSRMRDKLRKELERNMR